LIVGALYNPWTGDQTRQWLLDKVAGSDELEPLDSWETLSNEGSPTATETEAVGTEAESS
jgi:hypothetical protein